MMKKYLIISISCLALTLVGCKKDNSSNINTDNKSDNDATTSATEKISNSGMGESIGNIADGANDAIEDVSEGVSKVVDDIKENASELVSDIKNDVTTAR